MKLQKFRHACLLVTVDDVRVLLDPGTFSRGFEDLRDLDAVLVTHAHPDHLDPDRIGALLAANPRAQVHADRGAAEILRQQGIEVSVVTGGDTWEIGGLAVTAVGDDHAVIHPDIPRITNVGYAFGPADAPLLFHPGDALTVPPAPVDVLALPAVAPWMKVSEAVDYLRAVAPRVAVPIHEAVSAVPAMYYGRFSELGPAATTLRVIDDGEPVTV